MTKTVEQLNAQRQALEKQIKAIDEQLKKARKAEAEQRRAKALHALEKSGLLELPEAELMAALKGIKKGKESADTPADTKPQGQA